jgi:predicted nuclease of predicted toxin-antitoxin system
MKILVDMNLSPDWCGVLAQVGWEAIHCSQIGKPTAPDSEVLAYARLHGYVVFTHDLDFGAILAATRANGPSVIQVRAQDTLSSQFRDLFTGALRRFQAQLDAGAIVVVEQSRARVRILPLAEKP